MKSKRVLISQTQSQTWESVTIIPLVGCTTTFPEIDLFVKGGLAPIVLKNYTNITALLNFQNLQKLTPHFKV
jgi:hypothetical protein